MKTIKTLILFIFFAVNAFSQDTINHYDPTNLEGKTWTNGAINGYYGEYQIYINYLYWFNPNLPDNMITYNFECVSFPFVPNCFKIDLAHSECTTNNNRNFIILSDSMLDTINDPYNGIGWIGSGKSVYKKSFPNEFLEDNISYPASLASTAYIGDTIVADRMILPHTILRITLNVHKDDNIDSIAMSISWLYDNTRGRMQKYPFLGSNTNVGPQKSYYDVVFIPKFRYDPDGHFYNTDSNVSWFEGARPSGLDPLGSINYYNAEADSVQNYPYYPPSGWENTQFPAVPGVIPYFYPAPYVLLSPPLRNAGGYAYAGYDNNGDTTSAVQEGIPHTYIINETIDLNLINSNEKIIYNPSSVEIDCDLTFPEDYKFLTVHGKYPDKAWVEENNINEEEDLRNVLCPSDQIDEDGNFLTEYIVNNTLTIEPGVIIMDANINGDGTVKYHPDNFDGNFKLSPDLKLELYSESFYINDPDRVLANVTEFYGSSIYIEPGASLTLENSLTMAPESKIIVKRGGQLIIDGAIVTGNELWQGIEVWGTKNQPQNLTYQGLVKIINDGTVKNAACGVRAVKMEIPSGGEGEAPVLSYSGGIVFANDADFINNQTAARFYDYDYNSSSYFTDCLFETNDNIIEGEQPENFVRLTSIDGVEFTNNSFINSSSIPYWGNGIYSRNSHYNVKGKCISGGEDCTEWDYGIFSNLKYGIFATASSPDNHIDVGHNNFQKNFRGVYVGGISEPVITNNNFDIDNPFTTEGGYGLYLDYSTGYKVEDNNFYHQTGEPVGVGLIVNESGGDPNEIYRNWFTNLECGLSIQGKNRAKSGQGLQLKCNDYEATIMDKIVNWGSPFVPSEAGIASSQGAQSSNPEDMAGNLFQVDGQTPNDDYDDILNEANHITYYWPQNNNNNDVKPVDYTQNTVDLEYVGEFAWTFENGCPPEEEGGGGSGTEEGLMISIAESEQKIDSTQQLLTVLIDGGDTQATQTDVDNSVPPETMQVYNDLMSKSPYLSDTVVSTAIEKEDVLPGAMIRDIMVANPKAAKSEALISKLDERWNPLPEYMKAQILAGRSIVSIREEAESRLAAFKLKKAGFFNELVRYYLNDTVNPQASAESLALLLENENSLNAKYQLAMLSFRQGALNEGLGILNDIPAQFELTALEAEAHTQFTNYYSLLTNIAQQGKSIIEADSTQIVTLTSIEAAQSGQATVYARNILLALNLSDYEEPILLPDLLKSAAINSEYNELLSKADEAPGYIKVQPNPAKDYIIIEYEFEQQTDATIEINDITGNLKYSNNIKSRQDQVTVDIRNWKAGVCIATLKIEGKLVESFKFTIID